MVSTQECCSHFIIIKVDQQWLKGKEGGGEPRNTLGNIEPTFCFFPLPKYFRGQLGTTQLLVSIFSNKID